MSQIYLGLLGLRFQDHVGRNLETELEVIWEPFSLSNFSKYIITILALSSLWLFEKRLWKLSLYYLLTFLPMLLIMLVFYDTFRWFGGLRIFTMLMPAGIVVACGVPVLLVAQATIPCLGLGCSDFLGGIRLG